MSKKIILVIFPLIIFFSFHTAQATVVINEIMYDLDGGDIDYVEVVNQGETGIDLSAFKLLISNSTSNHAINSSSGSPVLLSGKYGVIVPTSSISKYMDKWGSGGNIFTSSFSLPNSTAKVEINDGDKTAPIFSVTYDSSQGASGDGESLQFLGGSWVPASPTPGAENQPSSSSASAYETPVIPEDEGTTPSSSNVTQSQKEKPATKQEIKVKIAVEDFSFSGIPLSFNATAYGYSGEELYSGKYFWNFGDGSSKEVKDNAQFTHTYFYPGDYTISLSYYLNPLSQTPDAVSKIKIKVDPMELSISNVGDAGDFFIEISNKSTHDMDLSGWSLVSGSKTFSLPRDTSVLAKNKIILSPQITGFSLGDKNNLKLLSSIGEVVFGLDSVAIKPPPVSLPKTKQKQVPISTDLDSKKNTEKNPYTESTNLGADLTSTVVNADGVRESSSGSFIYLLFLFVFLGVGGGAVYFIHHKKTPVQETTKDFEILDE